MISEEPSDMGKITHPTEVKIPLVLLVAGLIILLVYGLIAGGTVGVGKVLLSILAELAIGVPLAIVACFMAAKMMGIDFGLLHTAMLKLASAFIFPVAVGVIIPIPVIGWLVPLLLYWLMLEKFFDLDPTDLIVCVILIFVVQTGAAFLAGLLMWS